MDYIRHGDKFEECSTINKTIQLFIVLLLVMLFIEVKVKSFAIQIKIQMYIGNFKASILDRFQYW